MSEVTKQFILEDVMLTSIFLAKAIGLYFVIISLSILIKTERFQDIIKKFIDSDTEMLTSGFFTLILGIIMVLFHNVWTLDWRVFVTLISWIVMIKGILLINYPPTIWKRLVEFYHSRNLRIIAVIYLVVGLWFCWKGFSLG